MLHDGAEGVAIPVIVRSIGRTQGVLHFRVPKCLSSKKLCLSVLKLCFQNVAFQVCSGLFFALFCFNENKSCQIHFLNLRCRKALVSLASKVCVGYHRS